MQFVMWFYLLHFFKAIVCQNFFRLRFGAIFLRKSGFPHYVLLRKIGGRGTPLGTFSKIIKICFFLQNLNFLTWKKIEATRLDVVFDALSNGYSGISGKNLENFFLQKNKFWRPLAISKGVPHAFSRVYRNLECARGGVHSRLDVRTMFSVFWAVLVVKVFPGLVRGSLVLREGFLGRWLRIRDPLLQIRMSWSPNGLKFYRGKSFQMCFCRNITISKPISKIQNLICSSQYTFLLTSLDRIGFW